MRRWLGFAIFCAVMWYCAQHFGWFDWVTADHGAWYETKQIFSKENVQKRKMENQRRFNRY